MVSYPLLVWMQASTSAQLECYDWDQRFLNAFHSTLVLALILAAVILLLLILRPVRWALTRPYVRILYSSLVILPAGAFALFQFGLSHWPGILSFLGIGGDYLHCSGSQFEASGFLGGLLGAGLPAIAQPITIVVISLGIWLMYLGVVCLANLLLSRLGSPWRLRAPQAR